MSNLLIIDKDKNHRKDVANFFRGIGHNILEASELREALRLISDYRFDVIISDVSLPGSEFSELIRSAGNRNPDTVVIGIAEKGNAGQGRRAVRAGAFDFLIKPYHIPELNFLIKKAFERKRQQQQEENLREKYRNIYQPSNFIGESPQIKRIFQIVKRVAKTNSSVLLTGETGTGKEMVAGAIHYNSPRHEQNFVRVNCAALPEHLLESELFGYERGAFTGAERLRIGRFEQANEGTIFLDEVADMSPFTQAKVLRVLQEKEFERLGSNETIRTDVRIISATNKNLREQMNRGVFREDLYYRLNVINIRLPPLRERDGDIKLLARFFLRKYSASLNRDVRGFEEPALSLLSRYLWPGNIRELENTIERAVLMAEGDLITQDDLDLLCDQNEVAGGEAPFEQAPDSWRPIRLPPQGIRLEEVEKSLILQALEARDWVQKEAARLLGLSSRVLNYKIRHFGITHPRWKQNR